MEHDLDTLAAVSYVGPGTFTTVKVSSMSRSPADSSPSAPDVIVLGAGQAGLTAAIAATEQGCSVLILERQDYAGGSTAMSSGLTAYACTPEQEALGIQDSLDLLREDILATGHYRNDPDLVEEYCQRQQETYAWLTGMGVVYGHIHAASGQSVPRSHPTNPSTMIDVLLAQALANGAVIQYRTRAIELMYDLEQVKGVVAECNGRISEFPARAVVIATGGFSRNRELLEKFVPHMAPAVKGGAPGSQGDGLLMAWKIGADFRDTPFVKGTFGIYPGDDPRESGTGILAVYKGAIAVNNEGHRFIREDLPYKVLGDACLQQPGHTAYQIFDKDVMASEDVDVDIYSFSGRLATGLVRSAPSIRELADLIGIPSTNLEETVLEYNEVAAGLKSDPLGRQHLSGAVGKLKPLDSPPYYAHWSTSSVLATYCGLTIDPATRVLDVHGSPIPGLYAAGEVTGGFHGDGYVTGTSIGKAGVFGRLAGMTAAREATRG